MKLCRSVQLSQKMVPVLQEFEPMENRNMRNRKNTQVFTEFKKSRSSTLSPSVSKVDIDKNHPISSCTLNKNQKQNVLKKLKIMTVDIKKFASQVKSVQDEIPLMMANFSYILELVVKNLTNQIVQKHSQIFDQKNSVIRKQKQKINALEQSSYEITCKNQYHIKEIQAQLDKVIEQNSQLINQNFKIKKQNSEITQQLKIFANEKLRQVNQTLFWQGQKHYLPDDDSRLLAWVNERKFLVKKHNTIENHTTHPRDISMKCRQSNLRSLEELKKKIIRLKTEAIKQRKAD